MSSEGHNYFDVRVGSTGKMQDGVCRGRKVKNYLDNIKELFRENEEEEAEYLLKNRTSIKVSRQRFNM